MNTIMLCSKEKLTTKNIFLKPIVYCLMSAYTIYVVLTLKQRIAFGAANTSSDANQNHIKGVIHG